jgi:hypothetical protein
MSMTHVDGEIGSELLDAARRLSDDALLARVGTLAQRSREVTVELLAHLGELSARGLHRGGGCGRLFAYCTEVLKLSEAAAWNRIRAARAARRFPVILDMLADGRLNLTSVRLLEPHLTAANHGALLAEVIGLSRRDVDKVVARLAPRPDVKGSITAIGPHRFAVHVTLGDEAHDDLRFLQDALRREIADGDPSAIVARALRAYRREIEKKMFSATERPRAAVVALKPGSRAIPAAVERAVVARDGGRCAFVAGNGRRCSERTFLEFHHVDPHARGGLPTEGNVSLRCRAHNEYESEVAFGRRGALRWRETAARQASGPGTSPRPGAGPPLPGAGWLRVNGNGETVPTGT